MLFGIFGFLGGLAMLWAGSIISRIDAFGVNTFQGALICTGISIAFAVVVNQVFTYFISSPFWLFKDLFNIDKDDYEDEEEEFRPPLRTLKKPKKRR